MILQAGGFLRIILIAHLISIEMRKVAQ